jgi:hypothetical protein
VRAFLNESAADGLTTAEEMLEEVGLASVPASESDIEESVLPDAIIPSEPRVFVGDVRIDHVESAPTSFVPQTEAEWQIGTIPDDELPPFSPQFGTATPGFSEYVNKYNLNQEQVQALIKRICAKKGW